MKNHYIDFFELNNLLTLYNNMPLIQNAINNMVNLYLHGKDPDNIFFYTLRMYKILKIVNLNNLTILDQQDIICDGIEIDENQKLSNEDNTFTLKLE